MSSTINKNQYVNQSRPPVTHGSTSFLIQQPNKNLQPHYPIHHHQNNNLSHNFQPKSNFVTYQHQNNNSQQHFQSRSNLGTSQPQNINYSQQHIKHRRINSGNLQGKLQKDSISRITQPRPPQSKTYYVPYEYYYTDYEQQQVIQTVMVPVQKKCTKYYRLQTIIDYIPKQHQQTIVEMVPQQKVNMRLAYVPVETKMIHYPKGTQNLGTKIQNINTDIHRKSYSHLQFGNRYDGSPHNYQINKDIKISGMSDKKIPKTNYVTSDHYVPSQYYDEQIQTQNYKIKRVQNYNQQSQKRFQKQGSKYQPTYHNND